MNQPPQWQPSQQPGQPWPPQSSQPAQWQPQPPPYAPPPGQWQQPDQPWPPQQPIQPPPPKKKRRIWLWIAVGIIVLGLCNAISHATSSGSATSTTSDATTTSAQAAATKPPAPTPTPVIIHYPPKALADLHNLAAKGDAGAIHEFHSESVGLTGVCPQPKQEVTVDPGLTDQQLAEDLLAYFYDQQLDSPCGSIVFAEHNQSDANDVYTAGRIKFDVTDSSGSFNVDPNASTNDLKHTLTLDIGNGLDQNEKEYVVTY